MTVKINANDFIFGGLDEDESLAICKLLDAAGIDSIEVSGNGTSVRGIRAHVNERRITLFQRGAMDPGRSGQYRLIRPGGSKNAHLTDTKCNAYCSTNLIVNYLCAG